MMFDRNVSSQNKITQNNFVMICNDSSLWMDPNKPCKQNNYRATGSPHRRGQAFLSFVTPLYVVLNSSGVSLTSTGWDIAWWEMLPALQQNHTLCYWSRLGEFAAAPLQIWPCWYGSRKKESIQILQQPWQRDSMQPRWTPAVRGRWTCWQSIQITGWGTHKQQADKMLVSVKSRPCQSFRGLNSAANLTVKYQYSLYKSECVQLGKDGIL